MQRLPNWFKDDIDEQTATFPGVARPRKPDVSGQIREISREPVGQRMDVESLGGKPSNAGHVVKVVRCPLKVKQAEEYAILMIGSIRLRIFITKSSRFL